MILDRGRVRVSAGSLNTGISVYPVLLKNPKTKVYLAKNIPKNNQSLDFGEGILEPVILEFKSK